MIIYADDVSILVAKSQLPAYVAWANETTEEFSLWCQNIGLINIKATAYLIFEQKYL